MTAHIEAYEGLKSRFAEISRLSGIAGILSIDQQTAMPSGGIADRTAQQVALSGVLHEKSTDSQIGRWLDVVLAHIDSFAAEDRRNIALMKDRWDASNKLSAALVAEISALGSEGDYLHTTVFRPEGKWEGCARDHYARAFDVVRRQARALNADGKFSSDYDALLDLYQPGLTDAMVERVFAPLEKALPALIRAVREKQAAEPAAIPLRGPFPPDRQYELYTRMARATGFDFSRGKLYMGDFHPSCNGAGDDVRLTTNRSDEDFLDPVYSTVHEAGHGVYEQNTPPAWKDQPAGASFGMMVHESQSRIIEINACRTRGFFEFLSRQAQEIFDRPGDESLSADNLRRLMTKVEPSFIRTEADEVTYPVHVMLRWKIERAVIGGAATVDDIPQMWAEGMKNMLGITPPDPRRGWMQDVHWPTGSIGYFPTYALGSMMAAQLFAAAERVRPDIRAEIGKGNFTPLQDWLHENVHGRGSLLTLDDLLIAATGEVLNPQYWIDHIEVRYLA